jgi:hypothetical protein
MIALNRSQAIYGFPPLLKHPALPNLRALNENKGRGVGQSHEKNSRPLVVSDQVPDPAIVILNTAYRQGGSDHHDQEPSLLVKRHFR